MKFEILVDGELRKFDIKPKLKYQRMLLEAFQKLKQDPEDPSIIFDRYKIFRELTNITQEQLDNITVEEYEKAFEKIQNSLMGRDLRFLSKSEKSVTSSNKEETQNK